MDTDDEDLCKCMEGMAGGDTAFLFTFHQRFGPKLAWVVRDILRQMGRIDILANADEVDGLVLDACEVVFDRSSAWHPGGALPWNWARQAIRSKVAMVIGHRVVEFDLDSHAMSQIIDRASVGSGRVESEAGFLGVEEADLTLDPRARLLDTAIRSVGCRRSQEICWQYGIQKGLGDPSPAITVAQMFAVTPGNVRQIFRRQKAKVAAVIASDQRFETLREIEWFAA